jgi:arylsulfatase A-like enzyme
MNVPLVIVDPRYPGGARAAAVSSHLDLVPTILALAGLSAGERQGKYPMLKGHDLSGVVRDSASDGPRGSSKNPGKGALYTYDMIATIDAEWLQRNAAKLVDTAAAEAGLELHRGPEFLALLDEILLPSAGFRRRAIGEQ